MRGSGAITSWQNTAIRFARARSRPYLRCRPWPSFATTAWEKSVNINAYLTQVSEYGGFWARLAGAIRAAPHISYRIQMLWAAGFWSPEHDQNRPAPESGVGEPEGLAQEKTAGA